MAIKTISQFPSGTPTNDDYILFEQNGEGKSAKFSDCSLRYEEIMASTDLSGKIASASALKSLKPVCGIVAKGYTASSSFTPVKEISVTIPSNSIFGISAWLDWSTAMPTGVFISTSTNTGGNPDSYASAYHDSINNGNLGCSVSGYNSSERTYYVWAKVQSSGVVVANLNYWYIQL